MTFITSSHQIDHPEKNGFDAATQAVATWLRSQFSKRQHTPEQILEAQRRCEAARLSVDNLLR